MNKSILRKDKRYTFSDYFELNNPIKEILDEFGYSYRFGELSLPRTSQGIKSLERLRNTYISKLPQISLNSEVAKREFYISPLLLELLDYVEAEIDVDYPLDAGDNLSGTVDYLVKYSSNVIIIEAKKGDLEKGFNQLAVELIALDKYDESLSSILYGAVTLGDVWRFGCLERETKILRKDMNAYVLPANVEDLISIMIGLLELDGTSHFGSVNS